jgi:hypothetical protein
MAFIVLQAPSRVRRVGLETITLTEMMVRFWYFSVLAVSV